MSIEDYADVHIYGPPQPVNIFFLDYDPVQAAQMHCDKHVVKMILETAQLLSTAWHELADEGLLKKVVYPAVSGAEAEERYRALIATGENYCSHWTLLGNRIYAPTHTNHRCAVWARTTGGNYDWLWRLGMALLAEYTHRYGRQHASRGVMYALECVPPALHKTMSEWTESPPAMPFEFRVKDETGRYYDSVASYRNYYLKYKQDLLRYTKRKHPDWMEVINGKFVAKRVR